MIEATRCRRTKRSEAGTEVLVDTIDRVGMMERVRKGSPIVFAAIGDSIERCPKGEIALRSPDIVAKEAIDRTLDGRPAVESPGEG